MTVRKMDSVSGVDSALTPTKIFKAPVLPCIGTGYSHGHAYDVMDRGLLHEKACLEGLTGPIALPETEPQTHPAGGGVLYI